MKATNNKLAPETDFLRTFRGRFIGIMQWDQLDQFWKAVEKKSGAGWYIYAIGEEPPTEPCDASMVVDFTMEINALLRKEHEEEYCGIVYADNKTDPTIIKIFDPGNLGVVCGFSDSPPLPGWMMSTIQPVKLDQNSFLPANRRRWWQHIWKKAS